MNTTSEAAKKALADSGYTVNLEGTVTKTGTDTYSVAGTAVSSKDLSAAVTKAFETYDKLTLDKGTAARLSEEDSITLPKTKTLEVTDGSSNTVTAKALDTADAKVKIGGNKTDGYYVKGVDGDTLKLDTITVATTSAAVTSDLQNVDVNTLKVTSGTVKTDGTVKATNLVLGADAKLQSATAGKTVSVEAENVYIADPSVLSNVILTGDSLKILNLDGSDLNADQLAVAKKYVADGVAIHNAAGTTVATGTNGKTEDSTEEKAKAEAKAKAETAAKKVLEPVKAAEAFVSKDAYKNVNPFTTPMPTVSSLEAAKTAIDKFNADSQTFGGYTFTNKELGVQITDVDVDSLEKKVVAATKVAGKPLAAASLTGARSGMVLSELATQSVTDRTSDLRDGAPASAVANKAGEESVWFSVKHSDMDVDDSNDYGKSKVKLTAYTLGYDMQTSPEDFFGVYIGSTTGHADFNARVSGQIDVKDAVHGGVYGTHLLGNGQYLDYQLGGSTFDNKYRGKKWSTNTHGVMFGYGLKTKSSDQLTVNPYIRFKYDHISVGDAEFANKVTSDAVNAWSTKLGVNFQYTSGLYAGLAYSRGLSGSYDTYVNGVAMPTSDFDASVFYLNLGYRGLISPTTEFNVNAEKTFCDYDGWSALGRFDFHF